MKQCYLQCSRSITMPSNVIFLDFAKYCDFATILWGLETITITVHVWCYSLLMSILMYFGFSGYLVLYIVLLVCLTWHYLYCKCTYFCTSVAPRGLM